MTLGEHDQKELDPPEANEPWYWFQEPSNLDLNEMTFFFPPWIVLWKWFSTFPAEALGKGEVPHPVDGAVIKS